MEGLLLKWHGYLSGWCEQFFVLNATSLFAYKSQDDFFNDNPAEDYVNIGLCEIVVDANEPLHWEIRTTNSKKWFLKAHFPDEKQKWIQALGSCKACLLAPSFISHLSVSAGPEVNVQKQDHNNSSLNTELESNVFSNDVCNIECSDSEMKEYGINILKDLQPCQRNLLIKKCEAANCDISTILKLLINPNNGSSLNFEALKKSLNELLNLIDTMQGQCLNFHEEPSKNLAGNNKENHASDDKADVILENIDNMKEDNQSDKSAQNLEKDVLMESKSIDNVSSSIDISNASEDFSVDKKINNYSTFFSSCTPSFKDVMEKSVVLDSQHLIPIEIFLDACHCFSGMFTQFGKSLLLPLESDVKNNILKIKNANASLKFLYIQELISHEVKQNQYTGPNTGTQALFWLNLSFQTVVQFLTLLFCTESESWKETSSSFLAAYNKVLSHHHNWMVQRLFRMGVKMLPDFHSFIVSMSNSSCLEQIQQSNPDWEELVTLILTEHSLDYAHQIKAVSDLLNELFMSHHIKQ